MKTPFTVEQFLNVFRIYNEAVFPMQVLLYLLSIVAIYFSVKPSPKSNKIIILILVFLWLWMGTVYHLVFFTSINKAAYLFGVIFILQGSLFLILGVIQNKISFKFRSGISGITGLILVLFALIIYPMLGYFLGHAYPNSPTFGLPCPTTIFTFGLLLLTEKKIPLVILIIPVIWSFIGFTAAFNFGIIEDTGLLAAGIFASSILISRNRKFSNDKSFY